MNWFTRLFHRSKPEPVTPVEWVESTDANGNRTFTAKAFTWNPETVKMLFGEEHPHKVSAWAQWPPAGVHAGQCAECGASAAFDTWDELDAWIIEHEEDA